MGTDRRHSGESYALNVAASDGVATKITALAGLNVDPKNWVSIDEAFSAERGVCV